MSILQADYADTGSNPYQVKEVRFPSGERMPLLVRRSCGVAIEAPSFWITSERRPLGVQASTLQQDLRNLIMLYLWADARGFDLLERIRSPAFLKLSDLNDLDRFCRKRVDEAVKEAAHNQRKITPTKVARLQTKTQIVSSRKITTPTGRMQVRNRMASIYSFLDHSSCDHLSRLMPGTSAYHIYAEGRKAMLDKWKARYKSLDLKNSSDPRMGLDAKALERLRVVIHPQSLDNPWAVRVRVRNGLIVLLFWSLGLRRGELCSLRTSDLRLTGERGFLSVVRRPDDPADKRNAKPGVKTNGRELLLEPELASMIHNYILNDRRTHPGARRHPFLFVSDEDGAPVSLSSINKLFQKLRSAPGLPPDLSPHTLRRSWNDAFSAASDKATPRRTDTEMVKEERMRSYLMGWNLNSKTAATYTRRHTRETANERSLVLQKGVRHPDDQISDQPK